MLEVRRNDCEMTEVKNTKLLIIWLKISIAWGLSPNYPRNYLHNDESQKLHGLRSLNLPSKAIFEILTDLASY